MIDAKPRPLLRKLKKTARILRLKPFYQEQRGSVFAERWAMLSAHLTADDHSLIDIGCNIGQFTAAAAQRGMFAIGIDAFEEVVARARSLHRNVQNLSFAWSEFGPDTVRLLPPVDVIFCLSVHHYWSRSHGEQAAWDMIGALAAKSGKLFFEPASSHRRYGESRPDFAENDAVSIDDYVRRGFARVAPRKKVVSLGATASIRNEAFRTLYLIS
jgi:SAM-dependent methyltransferase